MPTTWSETDRDALFRALGRIEQQLLDQTADIATLKGALPDLQTARTTQGLRLEVLEDHMHAGVSRRWSLILSGCSTALGVAISQGFPAVFGHR